MLAYLVKCAVILFGLWLARYFHLVPWSDLLNVGITIIVPIALIAVGMRSAARHGEERGVTDYRRLRRAAAHHVLANGRKVSDEHGVER